MDGECGQKFYISDSVYGFWAPWGRLTLTTEQGDDVASNVIHLEPEVINALERHIAARAACCKREHEDG